MQDYINIMQDFTGMNNMICLRRKLYNIQPVMFVSEKLFTFESKDT